LLAGDFGVSSPFRPQPSLSESLPVRIPPRPHPSMPRMRRQNADPCRYVTRRSKRSTTVRRMICGYLLWFALISIGVPEPLGSAGCCGEANGGRCTCAAGLSAVGGCCCQIPVPTPLRACCAAKPQTKRSSATMACDRTQDCHPRDMTRKSKESVILPHESGQLEVAQCPCRNESVPGILRLDEPRVLGQQLLWPSSWLTGPLYHVAQQRSCVVLEPAVPPPRSCSV
jgi:hypothetical protein